jgi:hypothetical protein
MSAQPSGPVDTSPLDYSNDATAMIISCSILLILSTVFVALRFWSKRLSGAGWKLDDWLVLSALAFHHCFMISGFVLLTKGGLGRDIRLVIKDNSNALVVFFQVRGTQASLHSSHIVCLLTQDTNSLSSYPQSLMASALRW